jgi:hypothetical protein
MNRVQLLPNVTKKLLRCLIISVETNKKDNSKKVFIKLKKHSIILLNKPIKYIQPKNSDISEQDLADRWG